MSIGSTVSIWLLAGGRTTRRATPHRAGLCVRVARAGNELQLQRFGVIDKRWVIPPLLPRVVHVELDEVAVRVSRIDALAHAVVEGSMNRRVQRLEVSLRLDEGADVVAHLESEMVKCASAFNGFPRVDQGNVMVTVARRQKDHRSLSEVSPSDFV